MFVQVCMCVCVLYVTAVCNYDLHVYIRALLQFVMENCLTVVTAVCNYDLHVYIRALLQFVMENCLTVVTAVCNYDLHVYIRALLQFVMENCLTVAMSQACRYLREPSLPQRDKQFLKRELGTELVRATSLYCKLHCKCPVQSLH